MDERTIMLYHSQQMTEKLLMIENKQHKLQEILCYLLRGMAEKEIVCGQV